MDQNEKERFIAQIIEEVAELVEHMLERELPPEDFPDHTSLACRPMPSGVG